MVGLSRSRWSTVQRASRLYQYRCPCAQVERRSTKRNAAGLLCPFSQLPKPPGGRAGGVARLAAWRGSARTPNGFGLTTCAIPSSSHQKSPCDNAGHVYLEAKGKNRSRAQRCVGVAVLRGPGVHGILRGISVTDFAALRAVAAWRVRDVAVAGHVHVDDTAADLDALDLLHRVRQGNHWHRVQTVVLQR